MTPSTEPPVWRSLLYVPANNRRFLARAQERGADALILDLEDSVPLAEKAAARDSCRAAIAALCDGPGDVLVRINGPLRLAVPDLEAVIQPGVAGVLVTKCEGPEKLVLVAEMIAELEAERGIAAGAVSLVPMIESPRAYFAAREVAAGHPRSVALLLGGEDFATETGMDPAPDTLMVAKQEIVFAARAAGLSPLGLLDTVADIDDPARMLETARRSARFGFDGASCVHPGLIAALNEAFSPSEEEVAHARRVLDGIAEAEARGEGAARLDGRMIDAPIVSRARRTLARAERIAAREKRS